MNKTIKILKIKITLILQILLPKMNWHNLVWKEQVLNRQLFKNELDKERDQAIMKDIQLISQYYLN